MISNHSWYYTGWDASEAAQGQQIALEGVKQSEAKRGFVLLPGRWVVERSLAWVRRFRRLAQAYERLPETVAGLHVASRWRGCTSWLLSA